MNKVNIIDGHTHILNEGAAESYFKKNKNGFVLTMRFPDSITEEDADFDKLIDNNPRFALIQPIDIEKNIEEQIEWIRTNLDKKRIVAIKIFLGYQPIFADDLRLKPVYKFAEENQLTMVYHCGVVADELKNGTLAKYTSCKPIDEIAIKYPKNNFVISHFNFPHVWDAAVLVEKNKNVFTDYSGIFEGREKNKKLFKQVVADLRQIHSYYSTLYKNVLFGTDYLSEDSNFHEVKDYIRVAKKVFGKASGAIFYDNALVAFPRLKKFLPNE